MISVINTLTEQAVATALQGQARERRIGRPRGAIQQETQQTRRRRYKNRRSLISASPKRDKCLAS